eukprot:TRINITY_DN29111_c0_g1_i2.p1 TRINITY_DN29111_c0_g1~~TRINITY_DN29111_c0_g1_i2.p1  ORF type:complete len:1114 (-),score=172.68 TRINITY_DN29111_c0_g1_i2:82-3423(-)
MALDTRGQSPLRLDDVLEDADSSRSAARRGREDAGSPTAWAAQQAMQVQRSLPAKLCLVLLGASCAVLGRVGRCCNVLLRKFFGTQQPGIVPANSLAGPRQAAALAALGPRAPPALAFSSPSFAGRELRRPVAVGFRVDSETELVPSGMRRVAGFLVLEQQLPPGLGGRDLAGLVAEVRELCLQIAEISDQQALRLVLGMGYDSSAVLRKWREVVAWRQEHDMDEMRLHLAEVMCCSNKPVRFVHEADVYRKLFLGCPCGFVASNGCPVSVWHGGTVDASTAAGLPIENVEEWSREVFEYADLWISRQSERAGRLLGYVQVYDMQGISFRHVSSKEIATKLKAALGSAGFYVEAVKHIYVINASTPFSIAWKVIRGFITPWTASKITVSSGIPSELIEELGGPSSPAVHDLKQLLCTVKKGVNRDGSPLTPVLRPVLEVTKSAARKGSEETGSTDTFDRSSASSGRKSIGSQSERETDHGACFNYDIPAGMQRFSGFLLRNQQLPPGLNGRDLEALVAEVRQSCLQVGEISQQQALRLVLGMGYDPKAALNKWQEVVAWRQQHGMSETRSRLSELMASSASEPVMFPGGDEVCSKLLRVSPCALLAANGCPVSVWQAGTLNARSASELPTERVALWSREVYEYMDLWITEESERTGHLLGYVQVFDMQGLSLRHVSSNELKEKLQAALSSGGFYVEAVKHMYVINASTLFSMAWKVIRTIISPWTASKITVSSGMPEQLIDELGGPSASAVADLKHILKFTAQGGDAYCLSLMPVLRPANIALADKRAHGDSLEATSNEAQSLSECANACNSALCNTIKSEVAVPLGIQRCAGFLLSDDQLPPGLGDRKLETLVAQVWQSCSQVGKISQQQALRLVLGLGYDPAAALRKWKEVVAWRQQHGMAEIRSHLSRVMAGSEPMNFSFREEVWGKLARVSPCALLAANGCPVSVWHAGTLNARSACELRTEHVDRWSREVYEYKDLWITAESERTGRLLGYVQVYDMQGLSLRHVSSRDIKEKLRAALNSGEFYVEAVKHVYVINAATLFSMAWKVIRNFISPWTASKITVSSGIPDELIEELGGPSAPAVADLRQLLLRVTGEAAPVLRPAFPPTGA